MHSSGYMTRPQLVFPFIFWENVNIGGRIKVLHAMCVFTEDEYRRRMDEGDGGSILRARGRLGLLLSNRSRVLSEFNVG